MGPGACSHISVSFVTCTLGTLGSRDKQQGPDLTYPAQCTIPSVPASQGAAHGPAMAGEATVSVVGVLKQVNARQPGRAQESRGISGHPITGISAFWGKITFKESRHRYFPGCTIPWLRSRTRGSRGGGCSRCSQGIP